MSKVAVVTGGAGGMGFATAKLLGKDHRVVISDVNAQRLEKAAAELKQSGIECNAIIADIADATAVATLVQRSTRLGRLACMVHAAGISPTMGDPRRILAINALGTVNVTNACLDVAGDGFALVNVASMAAHMLPTPALRLLRRLYPLALTDPDRFVTRVARLCSVLPKELYRSGLAYALSKHFVIWLGKTRAGAFGEKGARILSVSPGSFDTAMGRAEEKSGSARMLETAALKRFGKPDEIAELLAFCASDKAGYLTGTDILCDGGVIAGRA